MLVLYLPAVKIGKTVSGKEHLQHSGTTSIVFVSCNTLHSNVVPLTSGRVGLAEREGLVWDLKYRGSELPLRVNITLQFMFIFIFMFIQTLLSEKENLDLFYDGSPPILK
jgi:hypothetical protein